MPGKLQEERTFPTNFNKPGLQYNIDLNDDPKTVKS